MRSQTTRKNKKSERKQRRRGKKSKKRERKGRKGKEGRKGRRVFFSFFFSCSSFLLSFAQSHLDPSLPPAPALSFPLSLSPLPPHSLSIFSHSTSLNTFLIPLPSPSHLDTRYQPTPIICVCSHALLIFFLPWNTHTHLFFFFQNQQHDLVARHDPQKEKLQEPGLGRGCKRECAARRKCSCAQRAPCARFGCWGWSGRTVWNRHSTLFSTGAASRPRTRRRVQAGPEERGPSNARGARCRQWRHRQQGDPSPHKVHHGTQGGLSVCLLFGTEQEQDLSFLFPFFSLSLSLSLFFFF